MHNDDVRLVVHSLFCIARLIFLLFCLSAYQSKLSFHLKTLKEANLVRSRQEGSWIYYSLNLSQFVALEQYLSEYRRFSQVLPVRICADQS
jgi:ArsR family transcriptional regulator, arsenate/arsenite/antimonite-responsive transcriptional repressor